LINALEEFHSRKNLLGEIGPDFELEANTKLTSRISSRFTTGYSEFDPKTGLPLFDRATTGPNEGVASGAAQRIGKINHYIKDSWTSAGAHTETTKSFGLRVTAEELAEDIELLKKNYPGVYELLAGKPGYQSPYPGMQPVAKGSLASQKPVAAKVSQKVNPADGLTPNERKQRAIANAEAKKAERASNQVKNGQPLNEEKLVAKFSLDTHEMEIKDGVIEIFEKKPSAPEKPAAAKASEKVNPADGLTANERKQRAIANAEARKAERASRQVTVGQPAENVSTTVGKKKNVIKGGRLMSDIPDRSALRKNRRLFTRTSSKKIFFLKY